MLTVLIATYNGSSTLSTVLDSYCSLESPAGGWKLVIVDNGSTDDTKEKVFSFSRSLPLTYLFEPKRGKNSALNAGLAHVSGDLLVFTDDDVIPNPAWLKQMRHAADSLPEYSIFGGPVEPMWERPPESWLLKWVPLDPTYAVTPPMEEGPTPATLVFGPNMAVRAAIVHAGHYFDEGIGPNGSSYAQGSETEYLKRLSGLGFKAWHIKDAVVKHMIRSSQMDREWVLARAVRFGRGQYRIEEKDAQSTIRMMFGVPRYMFRQIISQGIRVAFARLAGNQEQVFKRRWKLNYMIGQTIEARAIFRESVQRRHAGGPVFERSGGVPVDTRGRE
jgi:glycosyltransferase involved in cell wall biosynthesis